jgi:hypothetical protein
LTAKIDQSFKDYFENVLLKLEDNSEESLPAINSIINRDELETEAIRGFLEKQALIIPTLDEVPSRLHSLLFEIKKIEASWGNCIAYLSTENSDVEILINYLNDVDTLAALSRQNIPDTELAKPLRKFVIENDALNDEAYRAYVRVLPNEFKKFPENLSAEKLLILIEEKKISFSPDNVSFLDVNDDLQLLFVSENIKKYLANENEYDLDDDFREELLSRDITDDHRLEIIEAMDFTLFASLRSRAAIVGSILARSSSEISDLGVEPIRAIIVNSSPIEIQIILFNKYQPQLENSQIREILDVLPEPFSEIKTGHGSPRINKSDVNIEFVTWLKSRNFISSWSLVGFFVEEIRINLFHK